MSPETAPAPHPRALRQAFWAAPVTEVRYVDRARADALARMGIETVEDLLRHYPMRYLDLSSTPRLSTLHAGQEVTAVGTVHEVTVKKPRPRLTITEIAITDGTGTLVGVWFNQPYVAQRVRAGEQVALAGRVQMDYGMRQMRSPFIERLGSSDGPEQLGRILPVHHATEGVSTNWMRRLVVEALDQYADGLDHLPSALRMSRDLVPLAWALRRIHFPESHTDLELARRRLVYDEFLAIQAGLATRRAGLAARGGRAHVTDGPARAGYLGALSFRLTGDQERALSEIAADLSSPRGMNRLLLGDVGSGKTAVAGGALAIAHDTGTQAAMMAPTEVLANQYARHLGSALDAAGIPWALLTGSTPAGERDRILARLADGTLSVVFGTHALLTAHVRFRDLTLAIVDEQHRFGVGQRLGLRAKGEAVDLLVMSATPIPRSLALTLYGDLDASFLRERPGGRGPGHVRSELVPKTGRQGAYDAVRAAVGEGRQAYVVCALVDESDALEARAATKEAERLARHVFSDLRVGLLTGPMKATEKRSVMERFRAGEIDVLVASTVIEVGVDVPNATVMIVEDAERFGLATLHQLRGRIGRGEYPGRFLLFADPGSEEGRERMRAIVSTDDGFALAEADLRLRGQGQILGERQHGLPELRLASVLGDADVLDEAREDAQAIVGVDPGLDDAVNRPLRTWMRGRFGREWKWVSAG